MKNKNISTRCTQRNLIGAEITIIVLSISLWSIPTFVSAGESVAASAKDDTETTSLSEDRGKEFGRIDGDSYINDYFGVAIDQMDDWTFANEDALADINGYSEGQVTQNLYENSMESGESVVDFYATDVYAETISLKISSLESITDDTQSETMSDEEFVQLIYNTMNDSAAEAIYNTIGLDEGSGSIKTGIVYILGKDTPCIRIQGTISGDDFYEAEVFIRQGCYYATIAATNYYDDYTDEVLGAFYSTEKGGALTHRDFDLLIGNEPVNMLDYCIPGNPEMFYYDQEVDESLQGVLRTARGIHLGDSQNEVIEAYGDTELFDFEENADVFSNVEYDFSAVTSFAIYDYQEDERKYNIIFFYNGSDELDSLLYYESEDTHSDTISHLINSIDIITPGMLHFNIISCI